jgi:hypothetical protein
MLVFARRWRAKESPVDDGQEVAGIQQRLTMMTATAIHGKSPSPASIPLADEPCGRWQAIIDSAPTNALIVHGIRQPMPSAGDRPVAAGRRARAKNNVIFPAWGREASLDDGQRRQQRCSQHDGDN